MERYYIYCSNNQAYHALINNSITAKAIMPEDFKSDTASFISDGYIFLTKEKISDDIRFLGIADAYYPVALEIMDLNENSSIPAKMVTLSPDGDVVLSDEVSLSEYTKTEGCVGAFILGEIPISYLCGIIFETQEQMTGFKKSSLDLWFPEDLFMVWPEREWPESLLTDEIIHIASEMVDKSLDFDEYQNIYNLLSTRLRVKAASYYAIEATEDWNIGKIKTNIDEALLHYLDGNSSIMTDLVKQALEKLDLSEANGYEVLINAKDGVFDPDNDGINKKIFNHIVSVLLNQTHIRERVPEDAFNTIGKFCIDSAGDDSKDMKDALATMIRFLKSNMDPDEALEAMGSFDVLRSFMMFIDQQETSDFMKRACIKLSQNEKRYTYIMYGILNGMAEVERPQKSNRSLEYRLEQLVCERFSNPHIISVVLPVDETVFMKRELANKKDDSAYGITPSFKIWFDCITSQKKLLTSASDKDLETIYKLMSKTSKDNPIPEEDVYAFRTPIVISVKVEGKEVQKYEVKHKKDAKTFGKQIESVIKKEKEVFTADGFKKYLSDEKRYRKFYKKNVDKIQDLCRKA